MSESVNSNELASSHVVGVTDEPLDLVVEQVVDGVANLVCGSVSCDGDGEGVVGHGVNDDMPAQKVKSA